MRKNLLVSLMIIGAALMSMGGTAFAFLSDSEASIDNLFAAGTLDLKIKDQDEHFYGDGVTATWKMSEMKPGDEVSGWVRLRNEGSVEASWLDIDVSNTVIDPPGPESDTQENTNDLDAQMIITEMVYQYYTLSEVGTHDLLSQLSNIDGDGNITLDEF